ncbi:MAG: TonB-dependent receptor [Capnocytophaga sp.]|nr:TonB-dependent receptor [Capnocytophaga sp.]
MKRQLLAYVFLFFTMMLSAQKGGVISGKVTDMTNVSLPGASIVLDKGNRYTISDNVGSFEFLNVPEGTYKISAVYLGFKTEEKEVTVQSGKNVVINFTLSEEVNQLEQVVITGESLRGQARALNQQKNRQNISNVISSDQVGRFPDANIGDALKRVPGVTMQNDQGEARNIIVRGLAPNLNSVTLDGDRIPSAEGDNRNVQMDLIPSDMISSIEVNKTLTSDMDADAIGGSVNLITRAAPNRERISATVAGGYSPIRDKGNYTAGFVYGNRFFDSKLGAVLSASYNNNLFGSDNVEAIWSKWDRNGNQLEYISQLDIRKYDIQRIRRSISLAMDYEINENNHLFFKSLYNWRDDRENRYRARYRGIKPIFNGTELTGFEGDIRRQLKGGIDDNRNQNTRLEDQRMQNYSLVGEHLISSSVDLDWALNYTKASEDRPSERYIEFQNRALDFSFNNNPETPLYSLTGTTDNAADYSLRNITQNHNYTEEDEVGFKLNVRVPFSVVSEQKGRIRAGLRLRMKSKMRENIFYTYKDLSGAITMTSIPTLFIGNTNWQVGEQYTPGIFPTRSYLGGLDLANATLFEQNLSPADYLPLNYKAKERVYANYIRWDQDFTSRLSMIAGVRLEITDTDYTGNYYVDGDTSANLVSSKNSYTNFLPSLAFKYDATDDLILRLAYSTALARPDYYSLAPSVNIYTSDNSIEAGNSKLKATFAHNFDLMAEQYFKSVGIISAGAFYKRLNNFIYTYIVNNNYSYADFANDFPTLTNPIPVGSTDWSFLQPKNGKSVDVYGFEVALQRKLDFLPGKFLQGFGVYVNYTYSKSKANGITNSQGQERTGLGLPGTAPHMFNSSLSWENKKFSARVSLNYTSDYLDNLGSSSFDDVYYDKQLFVDANASYKITDNFRIFAEANNLTNQPLRYYQGVSSRTYQVEYYRPKFNLGVKLDF